MMRSGGSLLAVGRLTKASVAEKACDLLQCPRSYAPVIQALSPR